MTDPVPSKDVLIAKAEQLELYEQKKWYFNPQEYPWLAQQLRSLAAVTAPEPPAEWRPIETAPDDGTLLLLCAPGGICIGPWPPAELTAQQNAQLVKDFGEWPDHRKWTVTHWMPLPEAPR